MGDGNLRWGWGEMGARQRGGSTPKMKSVEFVQFCSAGLKEKVKVESTELVAVTFAANLVWVVRARSADTITDVASPLTISFSRENSEMLYVAVTTPPATHKSVQVIDGGYMLRC